MIGTTDNREGTSELSVDHNFLVLQAYPLLLEKLVLRLDIPRTELPFDHVAITTLGEMADLLLIGFACGK